MALRLHVWGPVAHLASIDPECLAAIAYLNHALAPGDWALIRSNDPSVCPAHLLPALEHDGTWTSGFMPIVDYLAAHLPTPPPCSRLPPVQTADQRAYVALLGSAARPVLDAALYASERNWEAVTRPSYSRLLRFPLTWTVPHLVRADAVRRAETSPGLVRAVNALESDEEWRRRGQQEWDRDQSWGRNRDGWAAVPTAWKWNITENLRWIAGTSDRDQLPWKELQDWLDEELSALFAPFAERLALSSKSSEHGLSLMDGHVAGSPLDCLAYGYFALMTQIPLPHPFLRSVVERKHPDILVFVDAVHNHCFESADRPLESALAPYPSSPLRVAARFLHLMLGQLPIFGENYYTDELQRRATAGTRLLDRAGFLLICRVLLVGAAVGGGVYLHKATKPLGVPHVWTRQAAGMSAGAAALLATHGGVPRHGVQSGGANGPTPSMAPLSPGGLRMPLNGDSLDLE